MLKHFRVYWQTCVLLLLASAASATTIVLPTDDQLIRKSPVIVEGTVISSMPVLRGEGIWTETKLAVDRTIKGDAAGELTIREVGGEIDGRITKIFGTPVYTPGERVMAFLTATPRGDYQTMDLFIGKFSEQRAANGRRLLVRDDAVGDVALLDSSFRPIEAKNVQRDATAFESYVTDRVAGRQSATSYGVANPVLERDLAPATSRAGGLVVKPEFTLISEGTVYRWSAFDGGGSAAGFSYGTVRCRRHAPGADLPPLRDQRRQPGDSGRRDAAGRHLQHDAGRDRGARIRPHARLRAQHGQHGAHVRIRQRRRPGPSCR